jgi:hypothetical protein
MSKEELHELAQSSTPAEISVPETWGGLLIWAVGKWGVGIVFLALLVPVYQDLKLSNSRWADQATQNIRVMEALAAKIEASNSAIARLDDSLRRLEARNESRQQ